MPESILCLALSGNSALPREVACTEDPHHTQLTRACRAHSLAVLPFVQYISSRPSRPVQLSFDLNYTSKEQISARGASARFTIPASTCKAQPRTRASKSPQPWQSANTLIGRTATLSNIGGRKKKEKRQGAESGGRARSIWQVKVYRT